MATKFKATPKAPVYREDAVTALLNGSVRESMPALKGVSVDTLAGKLREQGVPLFEYIESFTDAKGEQLYESANDFFRAELGIDLTKIELKEFWTSDELRGMAPELFLETILMANLNAMVTNNLVTTVPLDRNSITIRTFEDNGEVYEVAEGAEIRDDNGVVTRRTVNVKKIGRGIAGTYESQKESPFPLFQLDLQRLGQRMALKKDLDVLNTLRTGIPAQMADGSQPAQAAVPTPISISQSNTTGSGVPSGTLTFADLVTIVTDIANRNYRADWAVMSPVTLGRLMLVPQVSNFLNAGPASVSVLESGVISHFLGMNLYVTKQMPDSEILAGQLGSSGVLFQADPIQLEEEKIISKQIDRAQVTERYGVGILYTQSLTRMPF